MVNKGLVIAVSAIIATSPAAGANVDAPGTPAPSGTPQTRYCLHVAPLPGSLVQTVQCWTRDEWAEQGVDVDKEWAKEGVGVVG
jgi:hypothetical protein